MIEKMKPILFCGEMVRAIIDGRKTQTRRVIKPQPPAGYVQLPRLEKDTFMFASGASVAEQIGGILFAPKYCVGDMLWVRETFVKTGCNNCNDYVQNKYCNGDGNKSWCYRYMADFDEDDIEYYKRLKIKLCWKPSIHMPRDAARIFLRVAGVRVERVQNISEVDAIEEGVICVCEKYGGGGCYTNDEKGCLGWNAIYRTAFRNLWNSINDKREFGWDVNPWVLVYKFEIERILKK